MNSPYFIQIDPLSPCSEFDSLVLAKEYPYPLDSFQKHAVCAIEKGHNVLVTAKTGSGKTMVGEHLIAHMLAKGKRVFYTTPIKSLSNQKFHDLKQMFPSVGILTGDIKYRPDAQVIIMTTEILRNLLYKENSATKSLGFTSLISLDNLGGVVFDECHYINDVDRGKVWEETMILLDPSVQQVLLSATIDKPELFAQWLGDLKKVPMHLISTSYRIVPLLHQVMLGEQPQMVMDTYFREEGYRQWIQWRAQKQKDADTRSQAVTVRKAGGYEDPVVKGVGGLPSYQHQLNTMVTVLERKNLLPAIFFVFSRKDCEAYADRISSTLLTSSESASIKHIWNFHLHSYGDLETMPQAHTLLRLVEKGIAFHHSGLVPILREIVEIMFGKGLIKVLFATETFAVGINMPTKTVVFTDVEKFDNSGKRLLTTDEYLQMAGRAGRRGKDDVGHVFYLPKHDAATLGQIKTMMTGVLNPVTSRMDFHYDFLLKALQNGQLKWEDILKNSYWMRQNENAIEGYRKEIALKDSSNKAMGITADELLELFQWDTLKLNQQSSVNSTRKKAVKNLEAWEEQHSGTRWTTLKTLFPTWKKCDSEMGDIDETVRGLEAYGQRITNKLRFLEDAGFRKGNELTLSGTLATEINEGHALLLPTVCIMSLKKELSCEDMVCLLAGFLAEGEKALDSAPHLTDLGLNENVLKLLYFADDYAGELLTKEQHYNCMSPESYWFLHGGWIDIARRWFNGDHASAICSEYGIYEGNFIRAMLKLGNLIEEWMNMLTYLHKTELLEKYKDLKNSVLKGIVKPQSLYLTL
jgi:superfamily II RNA helicase